MPDTTTATPEASKAGELKLVPESDLLAVKGAKEGLERRLSELTAESKRQLDEIQNKANVAEAKAQVLEARLGKVVTEEEHAKVKQELEAAQKRGEELGKKALEYRKRIIVATYNISADAVKDKTPDQLDAYEEALKAVGASRGVGNYAAGGGTGGAGALEGKKPMELARMAYANSK